MSEDVAPQQRTAGRGRVVGYDVARCLALLGMMLTHLLDEDALTQSWTSGRSAALFAVLAGVSLSLVSGRDLPVSGAALGVVRRRAAVRAVLVAAVGFVLGGFDSGIAVILVVYGVLFLLALPFLGLGAGALVAWGVGWLLVSPWVLQLLLPLVPPTSYQVPSLASVADPVGLVSELLLTGYYPALTWLGYVLIGMALGRAEVRDAVRQLVLLTVALLVSAVALLVSSFALARPGVVERLRDGFDLPIPTAGPDGFLGAVRDGLYGVIPADGTWWWQAVWSPHSSTVVDLVHTTATSVVVIAVCLLLTDHLGRRVRRGWAVVAGAGAVPLTSYTIHVLMTSVEETSPGIFSLPVQLVIVLGLGAVLAFLRVRGPLERGIAVIARETVPDRPTR